MKVLVRDGERRWRIRSVYLEDHFHGEDAGEGVIKVIKNLVAETALLHRILSSQCDTAQADDDHDEEIKVRQVHHPMGTTPNSAQTKVHRNLSISHHRHFKIIFNYNNN